MSTPRSPRPPRPPTPRQIAQFRARNVPFRCGLTDPWITHAEDLEPFHKLVGWDERCSTCQYARAFVKALTGGRHAEA